MIAECKLQRLEKQREDIMQLCTLFDRAAFRPYDKGNGGDPTAVLNAIWDTRIALATRGASYLPFEDAAAYFHELLERLYALERNVQAKYPEVVALAYDWRGRPLNTPQRIESIKAALGETYYDAADFIRNEAFGIYDSPEKAITLLKDLDAKIETLIENEIPDLKSDGVVYINSIIGSNVNINSTLENVKQAIGSATHLDETKKKELTDLVARLTIELEKAPAANREDAEDIANAARALVDAGTMAQPNKKTVKTTADWLEHAAEGNISVMPTVFAIALTICKMVRQIVD